MEGEENRKEMLGIFIEDTTEELSEMRDAFLWEIMRSWDISYTRLYCSG